MHTLQHIKSEDSRPNFSSRRKLTVEQQIVLWLICKQDRSIPSPQVLLVAEVEYHCTIEICVRQVNRWRVEMGLNRSKGRPQQTQQQLQHFDASSVLSVQFNLPCVGLHLFFFWLQQLPLFGQLVDALQRAIFAYRDTYPDESFPLLHHRPQTLLLRFLALLLAPLFGIKKLTEYDALEHHLSSLIGTSFLSSTLTQFLGQLEKVDAATYLMPILWSDNTGELAYIDGHMIAFWTSQKMHKGKITMLGRIMAGSQAVIAHNEHGYPLYFDYYAPDYRLPHIIVEYCQKLVDSIGIKLFVIDREINSLKMALTFTALDWGLLSMLDKNEYSGFESFSEIEPLTEGEDILFRAKWKDEKKRQEDPRYFVLMKTDEKLLAYWGTERFVREVDEKDWPQIYSDRNELQENGFKRMIAHGALNTNYGTKKEEGPDRHRERRQEKIQEKLEKASARLEKAKDEVAEQKEKIRESEEKGHEKRLEQRQQKLVKLELKEKEKREKKEQFEAQLKKDEEPKQRSDRDFRKQKVMTFRTLLLDKLLQMFFGLVMGPLEESVSMDRLLKLLKRSGGFVKKESGYEYWFNAVGLSKHNRILLKKVIERFNEMSLMNQGQPVQVRLQYGPD